MSKKILPYSETLISLPNERILAYDSYGDPKSLFLIVLYHGLFSVGNTSPYDPSMVARGVHYVTPTLPGWGKSSTRLNKSSYAVELVADFTHLVEHLYPDEGVRSQLRIYICGGSFGTIAAQMIHGYPIAKFPLGRQIRGMLLLAPVSPPKQHPGYSKGFTWSHWFLGGPPAHRTPFRIIPRLASVAIRFKAATPERAEKLIQEMYFDKFTDEDRAAMKEDLRKRGVKEEVGDIVRQLGMNMYRSVKDNWSGFIEVSDVLYGDWGFKVGDVDVSKERESKVMIVTAEGDDVLSMDKAEWLAENYQKAELVVVKTRGHLGFLTRMGEVWEAFLKDILV